MTKFYVDQSGNYLGGFDGADPIEGSIEVSAPPADARQKWNGSAFLPVAPTESDYSAAVQGMLDEKAREFGYDDMKSAVTYAGDPDATFNDQGTQLKTWRSHCWRACYDLLAQVRLGQAQPPTIAGLLAQLPPSPI